MRLEIEAALKRNIRVIPSAETPKVVYPPPPMPTESGGTRGKSQLKQVVAYLAIAAVLVVGGLIYLAIRPSQSPTASTRAGHWNSEPGCDRYANRLAVEHSQNLLD